MEDPATIRHSLVIYNIYMGYNRQAKDSRRRLLNGMIELMNHNTVNLSSNGTANRYVYNVAMTMRERERMYNSEQTIANQQRTSSLNNATLSSCPATPGAMTAP